MKGELDFWLLHINRQSCAKCSEQAFFGIYVWHAGRRAGELNGGGELAFDRLVIFKRRHKSDKVQTNYILMFTESALSIRYLVVD